MPSCPKYFGFICYLHLTTVYYMFFLAMGCGTCQGQEVWVGTASPPTTLPAVLLCMSLDWSSNSASTEAQRKPIKTPFKRGFTSYSLHLQENIWILQQWIIYSTAFIVLTCGCECGEQQKDEHVWSVLTFLKACFVLYTLSWPSFDVTHCWACKVRKAPVVLLRLYHGSW